MTLEPNFPHTRGVLGGLKLYEFNRVGVSYKPQNTIQYLYIMCASGSKFTFYLKLKQGLDVSKSAFTAKKESFS